MEASASTPVPGKALAMVCGIAGVALACLPYYAAAVPPMADLPAHVLVARIVADYSDAALRFSDYFTVEKFSFDSVPTLVVHSLAGKDLHSSS